MGWANVEIIEFQTWFSTGLKWPRHIAHTHDRTIVPAQGTSYSGLIFHADHLQLLCTTVGYNRAKLFESAGRKLDLTIYFRAPPVGNLTYQYSIGSKESRNVFGVISWHNRSRKRIFPTVRDGMLLSMVPEKEDRIVEWLYMVINLNLMTWLVLDLHQLVHDHSAHLRHVLKRNSQEPSS